MNMSGEENSVLLDDTLTCEASYPVLTIDQAIKSVFACASLTASVALAEALLLPSASSECWRNTTPCLNSNRADPSYNECGQLQSLRGFPRECAAVELQGPRSLRLLDRPTVDVIVDIRLLQANSRESFQRDLRLHVGRD